MDLKEKIINDINNNPIILYMKGTKEMPMCGFSNSVVQVLNHYGVDYKDINVLEDPQIRVKLSEHSNWPTIPQLFVKGQSGGGPAADRRPAPCADRDRTASRSGWRAGHPVGDLRHRW